MNKAIELFNKLAAKVNIDGYHLRKQVRKFASCIGHNSLILDVGSGKSPYQDYFQFDRYIPLDVAPSMDANILGDICNLPITSRIADVVVCTEVLEHALHPHKALKELSRVLKQGGYLILTMLFVHGVHEQVDFTRWTEMGLRIYIKESGFDIISLERRGRFFSCIGALLARTPFQLFGPYKETWTKWPKYGFLFLVSLLLMPLARLFVFLDALDAKKDYTLGYSVLAKKA